MSVEKGFVSEMSDVAIALFYEDYARLKDRIDFHKDVYIRSMLDDADYLEINGDFIIFSYDYVCWDESDSRAKFLMDYLDEVKKYDLVRIGLDYVEDVEVYYGTGRNLLYVDRCIGFYRWGEA